MACEGSYQGEPLCVEPGEGVSLPSNVIQVPEGCGHYYDAAGWGWWVSWPDNIEPPPADHQAPGAHGNPPLVWDEPKVVFGTDPMRPQLGNSVAQNDGYAPGDVWYNKGDVSGSPSSKVSPTNMTAYYAALATVNAISAKFAK